MYGLGFRVWATKLKSPKPEIKLLWAIYKKACGVRSGEVVNTNCPIVQWTNLETRIQKSDLKVLIKNIPSAVYHSTMGRVSIGGCWG